MTIQQIEARAIISDEEIGKIATLIFDHVQERNRKGAMRVRSALLACLHAFEDMHGLPHAVPSLRERGLKDGPVLKERDAG